MKAYQESIIKRFLEGKSFKDFEQEYKDHRHTGYRGHRVPTDKDKMIYIEFKKGAGITELARKHRTSQGAIRTSIVIMARAV